MANKYNILFVNEGISFLTDLSNNKKQNTTIYEIGENYKYSDICNNLITTINDTGNITHVNIGFLYHNQTRGYLPFFRDENNFSNNNIIPISNHDEYFSSNIERLIQDVSGISSVNSVDLDIITCRNDTRATNYLSEKEGVYGCKIFQTTGLIGFDRNNNTQYNTLFRISDNNTTKDVVNEYFSTNPFSSYVNSNGSNFMLLLGPGELRFTGISNSVFNLNQQIIDDNINEIRINGIDLSDNIINILEDITIPNDLNVLIDNSGNNKIIINGNNKKITVTDFTLTGLFSGLFFLEENSKIQINDLEVYLGSINFSTFGSSFIQANISSTRRVHTLVEINNCVNNNDLNNSDCGGLTGLATGFGGETIIQNCYNTGNMNGNNCGGLSGRQTGQVGSLTIQNCYNTGSINGDFCGCISSIQTGVVGNTIINNCYNTGSINGSYSGGITGSQTAQVGSLTVQNCYNTGSINGSYSGGILASFNCLFSSSPNKLLIENCYNTGIITGSSSGGISGTEIAYNSSIPCIIKNCYSTGIIDASNCGGIIGELFSTINGRNTNIPLNLTIENCYTTYKSFGVNSSGIIGFIENQPINSNIITRNSFSYDNGKIDQFGFLVGGNFNTSLLESGKIDTRLNTYGSYTSDNFGRLEYPLLRVFRDDITWNSDIYKNYDIPAVFGVSEPIDDRIKRKILLSQTVDRGLLNMNNIINRRVLYQNLITKPNSNNDNTSYTRLLKTKYKRVFNKYQK